MQMCKKSEKVTCTPKHIVDKMWKQWRIKGGKEKGKENAKNEEKPLWRKSRTELKRKEKVFGKERMKTARRKRLAHVIIVE